MIALVACEANHSGITAHLVDAGNPVQKVSHMRVSLQLVTLPAAWDQIVPVMWQTAV